MKPEWFHTLMIVLSAVTTFLVGTVAWNSASTSESEPLYTNDFAGHVGKSGTVGPAIPVLPTAHTNKPGVSLPVTVPEQLSMELLKISAKLDRGLSLTADEYSFVRGRIRVPADTADSALAAKLFAKFLDIDTAAETNALLVSEWVDGFKGLLSADDIAELLSNTARRVLAPESPPWDKWKQGESPLDQLRIVPDLAGDLSLTKATARRMAEWITTETMEVGEEEFLYLVGFVKSGVRSGAFVDAETTPEWCYIAQRFYDHEFIEALSDWKSEPGADRWTAFLAACGLPEQL